MVRYVLIRNKTPEGWAVKDRHNGQLEYYPTRDMAKTARMVKNLDSHLRTLPAVNVPW